MFDDWIKEKQTATDNDIEKDFQIPKATLKRWRLNKEINTPMHFRLGDTILYPRAAFIDWFKKHIKNKQADVYQIGSKRSNKEKAEN